jgi:hypothetical protein
LLLLLLLLWVRCELTVRRQQRRQTAGLGRGGRCRHADADVVAIEEIVHSLLH